MAFDSNSDTVSSTRSTGTFLCGEMARNQSGRLSGSMWRNSKSIFFSRSTIAARCTQGQVLKLTRRYFDMRPAFRSETDWAASIALLADNVIPAAVGDLKVDSRCG